MRKTVFKLHTRSAAGSLLFDLPHAPLTCLLLALLLLCVFSFPAVTAFAETASAPAETDSAFAETASIPAEADSVPAEADTSQTEADSASTVPDSASVQSEAASEEKAEYLRAGLYSSVSAYTHAAEMIEEAELSTDFEPAAEEYHDFVYNVSPAESFAFLRQLAEKRGAVQAGTFLLSADTAEQYRFLTEVNEFPVFTADKFTLTGGTSFVICSGDLLFWLDENGQPVNAGLVCSVHKTYCLVAVNNPEKGTALLCLSGKTVAELSDFMLVRPAYSSAEQQIYLYCRNTMGYTRAGACGLLANIAYESGFRTGQEETDQKMGIGICQWSYERRDDLNEYCQEHGLDPLKLDSQLEFMRFELENRYSFTGEFLKTVPDDSTGAYDAGYWVCFEYEQPVDFEFVSDERACLSQNEYWPLYGKALL